MAKLTKTGGTGMTQRGLVAYDWDEPGDVEAQIGAAIETFNRSSFSRISRRLVELATGILNSVGLPTDPEKGYELTSEGTWAAVDWPALDEETESDDEASDDPLTLSMAVEASGVRGGFASGLCRQSVAASRGGQNAPPGRQSR